ncbi:type II toxin-antitoxin system RelE/ParE family toxin [Candidatus Woesearchaeota archaeon]|nr:type II toxin-antitoxin system RelE/ParE family toxin [Candidatus Woesearchaeota archaeon]
MIVRTDRFVRIFSKIKDSATKERICAHIQKILAEPEIGKPMRFARKGTREVYVSPFRLSYAYSREEDKIIFLDIYHKDKQ